MHLLHGINLVSLLHRVYCLDLSPMSVLPFQRSYFFRAISPQRPAVGILRVASFSQYGINICMIMTDTAEDSQDVMAFQIA